MLGRFRGEVDLAERLGQKLRRLGCRQPVDAAVQRPPEAARDRDQVGNPERLRLVAEQLELRRQPATEDLDLPVDAGDIRGAFGVGLAVHPGGLLGRDAVEAEGAVRDVVAEIGRPEDLRLAAERAAAQPVHLPEPVFGRGEAEAEEQVVGAAGVDMRDAGPVAQNLDLAFDRAGEAHGGDASGRNSLGHGVP